MLFSCAGEEAATLTYAVEPAGAGAVLGQSTYSLSRGERGGYVSAQPAEGYVFLRWSDGESSPNRGGDRATENKTLIALFEPRAVTLTYAPSTPAGGTILGQTSQSLRAGESSTRVTAQPAAGYRFAGWSDGVRDYARSGDSVSEDTTIEAVFEHNPIDITVASLEITTADGQPVRDKETAVGATLTVTGSKDGIYDMQNVPMTIHGRGNSSWHPSAATLLNDYKSKNSYTIRLDEEAELLGIGRGPVHKYVLNANKYDETGLRNWICFRMGELFSGVPYASDMTWVDLTINGDYRGMYTLCEKVDAGHNRIDIEGDDPTALDRGYLIQLDKRADGVEGVDYFKIDGYYGENDPNALRPFTIENGSPTPEQVAFIKDYMQTCHRAILSGERAEIDELVDIPSFIDMFLITEMAKDVDANFASFYMYKAPGGKLTLTSPWDFDFGFGTYSSSMNIEELITEKKTGNLWFKNLLKCDWFCEEAAARLEELTPTILQVRDELLAMKGALRPLMDRNDARWHIYGRHYADYVADAVSRDLHSFDEHADYLANWIEQRTEILRDELAVYVSGEGELQK